MFLLGLLFLGIAVFLDGSWQMWFYNQDYFSPIYDRWLIVFPFLIGLLLIQLSLVFPFIIRENASNRTNKRI